MGETERSWCPECRRFVYPKPPSWADTAKLCPICRSPVTSLQILKAIDKGKMKLDKSPGEKYREIHGKEHPAVSFAKAIGLEVHDVYKVRERAYRTWVKEGKPE